MEHNKKAVRIISYIAGFLAIISSLMVMVLLIMHAVGLFYPRKEKIVIQTETIETVYDATAIEGGEPRISFGKLHYGHELVVLTTSQYTNVGDYPNEVTYMIVDPSGADVTDTYDIRHDFGRIIIQSRMLIVYSPDKTRRYNGEPLNSNAIEVKDGILVDGHTFVSNSVTSITDPGTQAIRPLYSIVNEAGVDVTDQYDIVENLGELTVLPLEIRITTASAVKVYDGQPLEKNEWKVLYASLMEGHTMAVQCYSSPTEVGSHSNEATVVVTDEKGVDVSHLYQVDANCGILDIQPIPLHISTGSMTKEYNGTPLSCDTWELEAGKLCPGDRITVVSSTALESVGTVSNYIRFAILDKDDKDVTSRYEIKRTVGNLMITPRTLTIRTGSATKQYDGTPLVCEIYDLIKGSICQGETIEVAFASITNIGYTQNYIIDCTILKTDENGNVMDVTENYSISFDYGVLKITT